MYLNGILHEGAAPEPRERHIAPNGWYSSEVMVQALQTATLKKRQRLVWQLELAPLRLQPDRLHHLVGAVSNQENVHWVALRARTGVVWLLDSNHAGPERLDWDQYLEYLMDYPVTYGIALL